MQDKRLNPNWNDENDAGDDSRMNPSATSPFGRVAKGEARPASSSRDIDLAETQARPRVRRRG